MGADLESHSSLGLRCPSFGLKTCRGTGRCPLMGFSSRSASSDWSCGGFGTLMNKGDSGGICCRGEDWGAAVEERRARDRTDRDVEAARGTRAGRGSSGGIFRWVLEGVPTGTSNWLLASIPFSLFRPLTLF